MLPQKIRSIIHFLRDFFRFLVYFFGFFYVKFIKP
jgi:hypothetical protein